MKKQLLLSSLFILSFAFLQAKPVDIQKALSVAAAATAENPAKVGMGVSAAAENNLVLAKSASTESNYYVFNNPENNGFVIISGDDAVKPVLGYSDKGSYDGNNLPPALEYWLGFLNGQITYAVQNNLPVNPQWDNFSNPGITTSAVTPLLSTLWDQGAPYNNLCPQLPSGRAVTGCVATAMAQIMKYHSHPAQGKGSTTAYITPTDHISIPAINLSNAVYDWANMLNAYSGTSNTQVQQDAVSQLMYHCGVSVMMDYDPYGSGAYSIDVEYALVNHFDYDPSVFYAERDNYLDAEWEDSLRKQIDAGLPVLYSGIDTQYGGHTFVCDGYNDSGLFHFNWGWSGVANGYFVTSALNPSPEPYAFNTGQNIIINIKPNQNGEAVIDMVMWPDTNMSSATTETTSNTNFSVTTSCLNQGLTTFVGYVGIALVNDNDDILAILGKYPQLISLSQEYGGMSIGIQVSVPANIPDGRYKMRTVAMMGDTVIMRSTTDHIGSLPLVVCNNVGYCSQYYASVSETTSQEVSIYPNPAEDIVYISGVKPLSVTIEDFSGRVVKQSNEAEISVKDLQSGVYIFIIQTGNGFVTKKILKK
jgi:hypothetical protein